MKNKLICLEGGGGGGEMIVRRNNKKWMDGINIWSNEFNLLILLISVHFLTSSGFQVGSAVYQVKGGEGERRKRE